MEMLLSTRVAGSGMFCKNGLFLVFLTLCLLPKFSLRLHFAYVNAFTAIYSFCECLSHACHVLGFDQRLATRRGRGRGHTPPLPVGG